MGRSNVTCFGRAVLLVVRARLGPKGMFSCVPGALWGCKRARERATLSIGGGDVTSLGGANDWDGDGGGAAVSRGSGGS